MLIFLILYALDAATSILRPLTDAFCDLYVMILLQRTSSYNVSEDTKDNLSRLFYLLLLFFFRCPPIEIPTLPGCLFKDNLPSRFHE